MVNEIQLKGVDPLVNDSASTLDESSGLTHDSSNTLNSSLPSQPVEEVDPNTSIEYTNFNTSGSLSTVGVASTPVSRPNADVGSRHEVACSNDTSPMVEGGDRVGSFWLNSSVVVTPLNGHNDAVCAVDVSGDILMTGRLVVVAGNLHGGGC